MEILISFIGVLLQVYIIAALLNRKADDTQDDGIEPPDREQNFHPYTGKIPRTYKR